MSSELFTQSGDGPGSGAPDLYPASLLDRFFDWVRRLPVPAWLFYSGLSVALWLFFSVLAWMEGVAAVGFVPPFAADAAIYAVFYVGLIHYIDETAAGALERFRPLLTIDDESVARLHYRLTTMPAHHALAAGITGAAMSVTVLPFMPENNPHLLTLQGPAEWLGLLIGNFVVGIFAYHTLRQLRLVTQIHSSLASVNLYQRDPVYAFSRLMVRTGLGFALAVTLGLGPRMGPFLGTAGGYSLYGYLLFIPLVILIFVLPVLSVRRVLLREKRALQAEVNRRLQSAIAQIHQQQDGAALGQVGDAKTLMDALITERDIVAKIPTWPWQPGAIAGFTTAITLPLIVWLLQQLLMNFMVSD